MHWKSCGLAGAALATLAYGQARAGDQPIYRPPAAWVRPVAIPLDTPPSGAAADVLLLDHQTRFLDGAQETYLEIAVRIEAPEGLSQAGNLIELWNPLTDQLTIHQVKILRGGKSIDVLAGGKTFTVLRRETNLEAAMINGQLTATLQPEGLQVGDVLDYAVTLRRRDPALGGHVETSSLQVHAGSIGRLVMNVRWAAATPLRWWATDDVPALSPVEKDGWSEIGLDLKNATTPDAPAGAPLRDQLRGLVQFGDYKGWADVSATAYPLYARAATLAPASPLDAEITTLKAKSPDPKARALAALQLVESQVRYLFVGLEAGGYTPASADLTWTRRFGDCKGKTALLLALLKGLGVEAEAALVSSQAGDGLDRRLPQMGGFDHVLVRATIKGQVYWLDATRMGDASLDALPVPNFHWALPVRPNSAALEQLAVAPPRAPLNEKVVRIDARKGLDKPAPVHVDLTLRQDVALGVYLLLKQASAADADRALRQLLETNNGWITADKVRFTYDGATGELHATLDGAGVIPLDVNHEWRVDDTALGYDADFKRETTYHRGSPYALAYPQFSTATVDVQLPDDGRGFSLVNAEPVNQTTAGVAYRRSAIILDGRMTATASSRTLVPEFPAAEAPAAQAALHDLSAYSVVLSAPEPPPAGGASSTPAASDPATLQQTAAAAIKRRDFAAADDALTQALAKGPATTTLYDERGEVRYELKRDEPARTDFQAALKLDPRDVTGAFGLARLDLRAGDLASAKTHAAAALQAAPAPLPVALGLGVNFDLSDDHADAIGFFDRALQIDATGAERAQILNDRCWARAQWGRELPTALADCDAALDLAPRNASYLDSRGLVQLRLNASDKAVADYTAALELNEKLPTSLFGRGLAELRSGHTAAGKGDLAAAHKLDPRIDQRFARWGLTP